MRIRSVCSVIIKSLTCVGLMVAFYAMAGDVCLAQERVDRSIKSVDRSDSPLIACLDTCRDGTCVNGCIATKSLPFARRVAFRAAPQSSVVDCFSVVRENIQSCGQAFLVPIENADWEGFSYCRAVATMVFVSCPAFERSLDPASTLMIGQYCLDQSVQFAENTIAQAQAGQLEPLARRSGRVISDEESQIQKDSSALRQQAGQIGAGVAIVFTLCINELQSNFASCYKAFPNNGDSITKDLRETCLGGARDRFKACATGKIKPPT